MQIFVVVRLGTGDLLLFRAVDSTLVYSSINIFFFTHYLLSMLCLIYAEMVIIAVTELVSLISVADYSLTVFLSL